MRCTRRRVCRTSGERLSLHTLPTATHTLYARQISGTGAAPAYSENIQSFLTLWDAYSQRLTHHAGPSRAHLRHRSEPNRCQSDGYSIRRCYIEGRSSLTTTSNGSPPESVRGLYKPRFCSTMTKPPTKTLDHRHHLASLDGIRGLAILMVFFFHYYPRSARNPIGLLSGLGWLGVDLFFTLSGFLITGSSLSSGWSSPVWRGRS